MTQTSLRGNRHSVSWRHRQGYRFRACLLFRFKIFKIVTLFSYFSKPALKVSLPVRFKRVLYFPLMKKYLFTEILLWEYCEEPFSGTIFSAPSSWRAPSPCGESGCPAPGSTTIHWGSAPKPPDRCLQ